jgi:hypothetical protein
MTVTRTRSAIVALVGIALTATAACSAASTTDGSHELSPVDNAAARAHNTIAYAEHLLSETPAAPGQQPYSGAPPQNLASPDETIGVGDLVVRKRYWTAPGSADSVYQALNMAGFEGRPPSGHGLPSLRAEDQPGRGFLNFAVVDPPSFIQGGELYVEMESLKPGKTIIAAYAEVYAHPVREAIEHISLPGATGTAQWAEIRTTARNLFGRVVARPTETLSPTQVAAFVDGFNMAPLADSTGGCTGGPVRQQGAGLTVAIVSNGTWKLTYPGSCGALEVTHDGHTLAEIAPDDDFLQLLEVLQHGDGTLTGRLLLVGGPGGAASSPAQGEITLSADGTTVAQIHTRPDGYFAINAQPGRYLATALSPQYQVDGKPARCVAPHDVTVRTNETVHTNIDCERR